MPDTAPGDCQATGGAAGRPVGVKRWGGTFLRVQWLGLRAPNVVRAGVQWLGN